MYVSLILLNKPLLIWSLFQSRVSIVFNNTHRGNCVLLNSVQKFIEIEA